MNRRRHWWHWRHWWHFWAARPEVNRSKPVAPSKRPSLEGYEPSAQSRFKRSPAADSAVRISGTASCLLHLPLLLLLVAEAGEISLHASVHLTSCDSNPSCTCRGIARRIIAGPLRMNESGVTHDGLRDGVTASVIRHSRPARQRSDT